MGRPEGVMSAGIALSRGLCAAMALASAAAAITASPAMAQHVAHADSAHAQRSDSTVRARWRFGAWVAGAVRQPLETRLGHVHDRDLFVIAVRASHPVVVSPRFALRSTVDVFPLVVATGNREYSPTNYPVCNGPTLCLGDGHEWLAPMRRTAYGAGIAPLGFEGVAPSAGGSRFSLACRAVRCCSTGAFRILARPASTSWPTATRRYASRWFPGGRRWSPAFGSITSPTAARAG